MVVMCLQVGEFLQYIIGWVDFFGLVLYVILVVFILCLEMEELVEWVLEYWFVFFLELVLLDIGMGSGCILFVLKDCWL